MMYVYICLVAVPSPSLVHPVPRIQPVRPICGVLRACNADHMVVCPIYLYTYCFRYRRHPPHQLAILLALLDICADGVAVVIDSLLHVSRQKRIHTHTHTSRPTISIQGNGYILLVTITVLLAGTRDSLLNRHIHA